ncbi:T9SS type A sorting domain-containing protein [candidate division KSB1 bacterium]|nr:T9SS type A sorting domain-containing protein [candidate division KSB1 bacterium]
MFKRRHCSLSLIAGCCFVAFFTVNTSAVDVTLTPGTKHQTIEGFGGGLMFRVYPYLRPYQDELYDSIFNKAGCNVVRICNYYDSAMAENNDTLEINMMKDIQAKYPQVKVFMASWSPPPYLKQGDTIAGVVDGTKLSLKKVDNQFVYNEYADYWYNSIKDFKDKGVILSWVSMQNEPDWPAEWEGCCLLPNESGNTASYAKALDAVYNKVNSLGIPLIGPDMTGPAGINSVSIDQYMNAVNKSQITAVCHHFYNGADVSSMRKVKQNYGSKPRYQTEYLINEGADWNGKIQTWFDHIQLIHNSLVEEDLSMYLLFAVAYKEASTHCFFSQDTINNTYLTRPIYYAFKHFSKSIHRGWRRIGASGGSLMASAYANANNDSMAVVVINTGGAATLNLKGIPEAIDTGEVFQTTRSSGSEQSKKYARIAAFGKTRPAITLDGGSITSVDLWKIPPPDACSELNRTVTMKPSFAVTAGRDAITVFCTSAMDQVFTLSLYDIAGKRIVPSKSIRTVSGAAARTLNGRFARGTYLLNIVADKAIQTRTVVVQ